MTHSVYIKLISLANMHWSGVLSVEDHDGILLGKVFLRNGQVVWAEGKDQEENLFEAISLIGNLDKDELDFLINVLDTKLKEEKDSFTFLNTVSQSGYLSTWATREALRIHLFSAINSLEKERIKIKEEPVEGIVGGIPFNVPEIALGEKLISTLSSMPDLKKLGIWRVEVWHPSKGPGILWPQETPPWAMINYRFPIVLEASSTSIGEMPKLTIQYFPSSIVAGAKLPDPYGTLIMVEFGNSSIVPNIITLLYYTPTFFILRALEENQPIHELA